MATLQVAIAGAGIAGLGAAIALKPHPLIDVQVYEKAKELREIGASIALGPNGMRTLERLGVDNALDDAVAFRNKSGHPMIYRHWKTNEVLSVDSHVGHVEERHRTARFYRAHLQESLLAHVDPARIHLSKAFQSVAWNESLQKLVIQFTDGTHAVADVLLGADGIHSPVRTFFVPSAATHPTGWIALRSVFPVSHLAHIPDLPDEAEHHWGPDDHTLFLSKLGTDLFTVVGSAQEDPDAPPADSPFKSATWDSAGNVELLRSYYRDWSPTVTAIVEAVPHTNVFPNTTAEGLATWILGDGRVTLAGDAAHAHGGAFAAGGSLALDDAWAFAASLFSVFPINASQKPSQADIQSALGLYEKTRKAHTDKLLAVVHKGNKAKVDRLNERKKTAATETDEQVRARTQSRTDVAWLHEHDVVGTFQAAKTQQEQRGHKL